MRQGGGPPLPWRTPRLASASGTRVGGYVAGPALEPRQTFTAAATMRPRGTHVPAQTSALSPPGSGFSHPISGGWLGRVRVSGPAAAFQPLPLVRSPAPSSPGPSSRPGQVAGSHRPRAAPPGRRVPGRRAVGDGFGPGGEGPTTGGPVRAGGSRARRNESGSRSVLVITRSIHSGQPSSSMLDSRSSNAPLVGCRPNPYPRDGCLSILDFTLCGSSQIPPPKFVVAASTK